MRVLTRLSMQLAKRKASVTVRSDDLNLRIECDQRLRKIPAWVAMHSLLAPSTACMRLKPCMAAHPEPGARLLQASQLVSRK